MIEAVGRGGFYFVCKGIGLCVCFLFVLRILFFVSGDRSADVIIRGLMSLFGFRSRRGFDFLRTI
jgi:hypothetical protein